MILIILFYHLLRRYECPYTDRATSEACELGTYSLGAQSVCSACPAGKSCPVTTQDIEIDCPSGTYSLGNQSECTICPAGWECPDIDTNSRSVFSCCVIDRYYHCLFTMAIFLATQSLSDKHCTRLALLFWVD